jgi:hypothetical protein
VVYARHLDSPTQYGDICLTALLVGHVHRGVCGAADGKQAVLVAVTASVALRPGRAGAFSKARLQ